MFKEADILTIISSEKKAEKSSHSIFSGELCQLSCKKVWPRYRRVLIFRPKVTAFSPCTKDVCRLWVRRGRKGALGTRSKTEFDSIRKTAWITSHEERQAMSGKALHTPLPVRRANDQSVMYN
jgi:hypothetical protein